MTEEYQQALVKHCIPRQLVFVAERLRSLKQTRYSCNDINAINNMGMLPGGYFVNHRFNDTIN